MSEATEPFELPIRVEHADIDELGHVNNVTYVRWVQDAAVAHWTAVAPAAERARLFWVVCATRSTTSRRHIWAKISAQERGSELRHGFDSSATRKYSARGIAACSRERVRFGVQLTPEREGLRLSPRR